MSQPPAWDGHRRFRVIRKVPESGTVTSFYLAPEDGGALAPFRPGQHIGIKLDVPGQLVPVMRSYTLSDSPAQADHYRLSIKREPAPADAPDAEPGLASNFMHDRVGEGAVVELLAPGGDFVLRPEGKGPVVLLAGGIGCTPLVSMLAAIADAGSGRDVWFIHGVRNGAEQAFGDFVRGLAAAHPNIHVHLRYSRPGADDVEGRDYDSTGHVDMELLQSLLPGPSPQFFLCGAVPFMKSLYQGLVGWGVDPFQINYEFFGPASELTGEAAAPATPEPVPGAAADEVHKVTFRRSGVELLWTPTAGSLLDLAEANGVMADFVCREGRCHTCLQHVADGGFTYFRDGVFPPMSDDEILICSARPTSDLVLDL
jgi:ferredoxin-NADP reductase